MAERFRNRTLKREVFPTALNSFCEGVTYETAPLGSDLRYIISVPGEVEKVKIIVYNKTDGNVSFSVHESKNKELAEKIVDHIISCSEYDSRINVPISIKSLSNDYFQKLQEFLIEYCGAKKVNVRNLPHGIQVQYSSIYGDSIFLNHFENGTFNVQGKAGLLKSQVIEGLSSYLEYSEVVSATLESYNFNDFNKSLGETLLINRVPTAAKMFDRTVKSLILPTFYLEKITFDTTDYSFATFAVLRGLEGFIKQLFFQSGTVIVKHFGEQLEDVDQNGIFTLKQSAEQAMPCNYTKRSIEYLYNFYRSNRHAIFHVDGILISTYIMHKMEDAVSVINETLEKIEASASAIEYKDLTYLR